MVTAKFQKRKHAEFLSRNNVSFLLFAQLASRSFYNANSIYDWHMHQRVLGDILIAIRAYAQS